MSGMLVISLTSSAANGAVCAGNGCALGFGQPPVQCLESSFVRRLSRCDFAGFQLNPSETGFSGH